MDSDTWWHLRAGAEILERRAILTEDPFSLTRYQEPWRYPGWLAQIILFGMYQLMGYAGLNLLTTLMVTIAFSWVWKYVEGPLLLRSTLLLLAATTSGVYWSARPQIMSFALSGVFIYLLERERSREETPLWTYPLVMAIWVNLHGGFVIGFILLAAYAGGEVLRALAEAIKSRHKLRQVLMQLRPVFRRYALILGVSLIGISLNPHGPSMLLYPFRTVSIEVLREYIQEWQSPDFHALNVLPFLGMILLAFISFSFRQDNGHPTDYLLVLGFLAMSFWAARNIAIFALASLIPISRAVGSIPLTLPWRDPSKPLDPRLQKTLNSVLAVALLCAALLKISLPLDNSVNQKELDTAYPAAAVRHLASNVQPAPIFNSYNWGAYLIWKLYPEYRSFVDGRTDLFDDEILEQYLLTWRGDPAWVEVFERWDIKLALLEPGSPLAIRLDAAGWQRGFVDSQSVLFIKPEGHE